MSALTDTAGASLAVERRGVTAEALGLDIDDLTAGNVLSTLDAAVTLAAEHVSYFGGILNRLESSMTWSARMRDTLTEGLGILVDADLSVESARFTALAAREALSIGSLGMAVQAPRSLLKLFA